MPLQLLFDRPNSLHSFIDCRVGAKKEGRKERREGRERDGASKHEKGAGPLVLQPPDKRDLAHIPTRVRVCP